MGGRGLRIGIALAVTALLAACWSDVYYGTMERFGKQKRDILADRVRSGQAEQKAAEEQFLTTYEVLKEVAAFDGGDFEALYQRMRREFERSEKRADGVRDRIQSIENVARDLFAEWEHEITLISNPDLRRGSERRLRETRSRYERLIRAMKRAESRMDPVLVAFRDQVLYLKHNLNAQAIASLQATTASIESDVDELIEDMRRSIRESEAFLATMDG